MGKFIKRCLIVGVICVVVGLAASSAGIFKGGLGQLKEQILSGKWTIDFDEGIEIEPFFELEEQHYFKENATTHVDEEKVEESFSASEVQKINIKTSGITIEVKEYDGQDVFVESAAVHKYQGYLDKGELYIIGRGQNSNDLGKGKVTVSIPSSLSNNGTLGVEIESAASVVSIDKLIVRDVELKVSAGTISWQELTAGELSIEMSAGAVKGINTTITEDTDIQVRAGAVTLNGQFGVETEIEVAAGKVEIGLADAVGAYNYDVSCAGGSVSVGDEAIEGIAKTVKMEHGALKHMDIECSMGAININAIEE